VNQTREADERLSPPPPLEANDQVVTGVVTAGWAIALIVLLIFRDSLRPDVRWWIWTCVTGLVMGGFGYWYLPRLKRSRARSAQSRVPDQASTGPASTDQSAPLDSGSNTVSSTETPGRSTKS